MTYQMSADFYPAREVKNGFLGNANLTIAHAFNIYSLGVFENKEGPGIHISFPGYESNGMDHSYVIPENKEAYAAMCKAVEAAVNSENHKGFVNGKLGPRFEVTSGRFVEEPYADARFNMKIEGLCSLNGISTAIGRDDNTYVHMPTLPAYEKDGEMKYPVAFRGLTHKWQNKEGKDMSKDYGLLMRNLVLQKKKELEKERHPSLASQINNAEKKAGQGPPGHEAPVPEFAR